MCFKSNVNTDSIFNSQVQRGETLTDDENKGSKDRPQGKKSRALDVVDSRLGKGR